MANLTWRLRVEVLLCSEGTVEGSILVRACKRTDMVVEHSLKMPKQRCQTVHKSLLAAAAMYQ